MQPILLTQLFWLLHLCSDWKYTWQMNLKLISWYSLWLVKLISTCNWYLKVFPEYLGYGWYWKFRLFCMTWGGLCSSTQILQIEPFRKINLPGSSETLLIDFQLPISVNHLNPHGFVNVPFHIVLMISGFFCACPHFQYLSSTGITSTVNDSVDTESGVVGVLLQQLELPPPCKNK